MQEEIKEKIKAYYVANDIDKIIDYITNLQEEIEELREDNYAYHQLIKIQNEREYRSKFLKEFQEEFGKNVLPDYDEIYKRYDKLKKENKKLKELCDRYEEEHNTTFIQWQKDIKANKKAIELIKDEGLYEEDTNTFCGEIYSSLPELLNILNGVDKE